LRDRDDDEETSGEDVRAWVEGMAKLSDEELAWEYLKNSGSSSNDEFGTALTQLVKKGSPATLLKLQAVFQDPAVWRGDFDGTIGHLEGYLEKIPGDKAAFGEKLKAAAKAALDEERADRAKYQSEMTDDYRKTQEAQAKAQLKKIDQFFKQTSLAEALAELQDGDEDELRAMAQGLQPIVARTAPGEVEARVLQAAAKAKTGGAKVALLGILQTQAQGRGPMAKKLEAMDADTRAAAMSLLKDSAKGEGGGRRRRGEAVEVGQVAATAILYYRFTPEEQAAWTELYQRAPNLVSGWLRTTALALAEGKPMPPAPDRSRVSEAETVALVAELGALTADKLSGTIAGKSPDQQLALLAYLERPKGEWPEVFKMAYLKIGKVSGELAGALGAEKWKGRQLDAALVAEVTSTVEKAALDGKPSMVFISPEGLLGGLAVSIQKNQQKMTREQFAQSPLKLPADKPAPDGVLAYYLQAGAGPAMTNLGYFYPLWKDTATTKAWLEGHRKTLAAAGKAANEESNARNARNDPGALEKGVKAILELQPTGRQPFFLRWMAAPIVEGGDDKEEVETDEGDETDE
jgi:hypothetical protein